MHEKLQYEVNIVMESGVIGVWFNCSLNSKAQTLTYIECRINASVGTNVIKSDTIIDGHIPENREYIPVVIGHSNSNNCFDYIFYDGGRWLIRTNIAQRLNIRFYKCIK